MGWKVFLRLAILPVLVVASAFVFAESPPNTDTRIPGAIALSFDKPVLINVQSNPITVDDRKFSIVSIGQGSFQLSDGSHLTATFNAGVTQYAKTDYWIYAVVFDKNGEVLGTASHKQHVEYIRITVTPTIIRDFELDFGISRRFGSAKYVVVSIGERKVPKP